MSSLLNPASIAVYGASERVASPAAHILRNLLGQGFSGDVFAINPKYERIAGQPCHPSQTAGGFSADLAVLAIPPRAVPAALQDCAAVGTTSAIVITAGFDDGTGPASQERLITTAKEAGIRFMGPNCLGLLRPHAKLNATFQPAMPPAGGLALISQSGAICSGLADMAEAEGLGFSLMMSLGNSLNMGMPDALQMAAEDPLTEVILAYIEGVRDGPRFRAALAEACRKKPVIVLKAGRHAEGAAAAATHTGALVGSDRVFSTVLREAGAVQVATLGGLLDTARLMTSAPNVAGGRLAIVTNGGGAGVLSADRLADRALKPAPLPDEVIRKLDPVLSSNWSRRNPVDIVGDATADHYQAAIRACLESDAFDAVLTLLSPQSMTAPEAVSDVILAAQHASKKPVMSCFIGGASVTSARTKLRRQRVPDFDLPEQAVQAFAAALRASSRVGAPVAQSLIDGSKRERLQSLVSEIGPAADGMLSDTASRKLLDAAGIPCPIPELATTSAAASGLFDHIGGPVVLKIASPDISHKSEVDGVRLKLDSREAVSAAFDDITARARRLRPDAQVLGVTVEPMIAPRHARELLIGVQRDPVFGPVLTFGAGGTLVELLDDVGTALLPVTPEHVHDLIGSTKIGTLLGAYRNMEPVDFEALSQVLVAVSDLCLALPELAEMDINPLVAAPSGLCAVDARLRFETHQPPSLPRV